MSGPREDPVTAHDRAAAETAQAAQMGRALIRELNTLRRNPAAYAEQLTSLRSCYCCAGLTYPGTGTQVRSIEGEQALEECLRDLMECAPLPAVTASQAISRVCQVHVADLQDHDLCSHIGTDGSTPEARLARAGQHREQCGENVVFGLRAAREVLYHMLLDDGVSERGHRANLLNPDFRYAGAAFGPHPSAGTVAVLLLADHFRARREGHAEQLGAVAAAGLGGAAAVGDAAAHQAWDRLAQDVKPDHLKVPKDILENVQAMDRPPLYKVEKVGVRRYPIGQLEPKPSVDPAVVRAFVHRVDANHDDFFQEEELTSLSHKHQLDLIPEDIAALFDEIVERRHKADRGRRAINWAELCAATQARKRYVPAVDVYVELHGGQSYQLVVEAEVLDHWCGDVCQEFGPRCAQLPAPTATDGAGAAAQTKRRNAFLAALLDTIVEDKGTLLQHEAKVRKFLMPPQTGLDASDPTPAARRAVCIGLRRLWAYQVRPNRQLWLKLMRAVGLQPVVPLPEKVVGKHIAEHIEDEAVLVQKLNAAWGRGAGRAATTPVVVREPPAKVLVHSAVSGAQAAAAAGEATLVAASAAPLPPWEDKRQHTEALVNQVLRPDTANDASLGTAPPTTSRGADPALTFDAQRKFTQLVCKQQRASDEQRFLASGWLKQQGAVAPQAPQALRGGSGAHSLSAPGGLRGHFHNSHSALRAADEGRHRWPRSLDVRWKGAQVDYALAPPLRLDAKRSRMDATERDQQFGCYFPKASIFDFKTTAVARQSVDTDTYQSQEHEFRTDRPQRHGMFGRRAFDTLVCGKPVDNPHGISEVETKPVEEVMLQQERFHEHLDRSFPPGQKQHFKTYLPPSDMPKRCEELASRKQVNSVMDGGQKRQDIGFFQNRHSDPRDMNLYTRPIGTSLIDKLIPMA